MKRLWYIFLNCNFIYMYLNIIVSTVGWDINSNRYKVLSPGEIITGKVAEYPSIPKNILCSSR